MLPVYVISLAGCEDRRAPLLEQLTSLGFTPRVVLGTDGRLGLPAEYEPRIDRILAERRARRKLTDTEFACALSHQAVYERVLQDNHSRAVVLEDDAIVDERFISATEDVSCIDGFDLVLFAHKKTRVKRGSIMELPHGNHIWRVINIPELNVGYAVSSKGAQELISRSLPISYTADWPCDVSELRTYAMLPQPIGRSQSKGSLIEAGRKISRARARWGNQVPPYSDRGIIARLDRLISKRVS